MLCAEGKEDYGDIKNPLTYNFKDLFKPGFAVRSVDFQSSSQSLWCVGFAVVVDGDKGDLLHLGMLW